MTKYFGPNLNKMKSERPLIVNVVFEWPLLEDRASLPYTNAVLMESMRMATIVPNALPHTATEDIQVNGYIIPKVLFTKSHNQFQIYEFFDQIEQVLQASICIFVICVNLTV